MVKGSTTGATKWLLKGSHLGSPVTSSLLRAAIFCRVAALRGRGERVAKLVR